MAKGHSTGPRSSYGIAEWYGNLFKTLSDSQRKKLVDQKKGSHVCRFLEDMPELAPKKGPYCSKGGGVCSIRKFIPDTECGVRFEEITATCPSRFMEDGAVFRRIGEVLLGTDSPKFVKEIPFLQRVPLNGDDEIALDQNPDSSDALDEDVGRIDMVLVHPEMEQLHWCAVELQAVYFSGGAMSKDFAAISSYNGNGIPMPGAARRPDFRSSGPKRLMPQLQIKVPSLRRWGKKMAIVVDRPFFNSLGEMDRVPHVSNADIVWFIVKFDEDSMSGTARLVVDDVRFTTLERAVEGLTAGTPIALPDFESKIRQKLSRKRPSAV